MKTYDINNNPCGFRPDCEINKGSYCGPDTFLSLLLENPGGLFPESFATIELLSVVPEVYREGGNGFFTKQNIEEIYKRATKLGDDNPKVVELRNEFCSVFESFLKDPASHPASKKESYLPVLLMQPAEL